MVRVTESYYNQLSGTISLVLRNKWEKDVKKAESQRLTKPSVMDIMGAKLQLVGVAPTPSSDGSDDSGPLWLALAMSVEEKQRVIAFILMSCLFIPITELMCKTECAGS